MTLARVFCAGFTLVAVLVGLAFVVIAVMGDLDFPKAQPRAFGAALVCALLALVGCALLILLGSMQS